MLGISVGIVGTVIIRMVIKYHKNVDIKNRRRAIVRQLVYGYLAIALLLKEGEKIYFQK